MVESQQDGVGEGVQFTVNTESKSIHGPWFSQCQVVGHTATILQVRLK